MPVKTEESSGYEAYETVCDSLNSPSFGKAVSGDEADLTFLSNFMNDARLDALIEIQEVLEDAELKPTSCDNIDLLKELVEDLRSSTDPKSGQLADILSSPHVKSLIDAHDDIAAKNYEALPEPLEMMAPPPQIFDSPQGDAIRMVGIRKKPDEPLGITVRKEGDGLLIARILEGSMIDRQGLLNVGDIIKEINGHEVKDPDQMQEIMKKASGTITFKVLPSCADSGIKAQIFMKTHFNYDPRKDNLIPCRDAGLAFKEGEILQIVNMEDTNWWQAKKVDKDGPSGLIPSQTLEEKRKAFVKPEYDYTSKSLLCGLVTKKKRKVMYQTEQNSLFDKNDLAIYEEVARMPPFQRKTLVLIGAQGVGRRTLKQRLVKADPSRFSGVLPHTSRPMKPEEEDGEFYHFCAHEDMERDIANNKYLEHGLYDDYYYGTKFAAINRVIHSGKMCIIDLNPQALKTIKTSKFMPYVVFLAAPPVEIMRNMHEWARQRGKTDKMKSERDFRNTLEESARIERHYKTFFDMTIVNDNLDETYRKLRKAIETLSTEPQWVPVSWVY